MCVCVYVPPITAVFFASVSESQVRSSQDITIFNSLIADWTLNTVTPRTFRYSYAKLRGQSEKRARQKAVVIHNENPSSLTRRLSFHIQYGSSEPNYGFQIHYYLKQHLLPPNHHFMSYITPPSEKKYPQPPCSYFSFLSELENTILGGWKCPFHVWLWFWSRLSQIS